MGGNASRIISIIVLIRVSYLWEILTATYRIVKTELQKEVYVRSENMDQFVYVTN